MWVKRNTTLEEETLSSRSALDDTRNLIEYNEHGAARKQSNAGGRRLMFIGHRSNVHRRIGPVISIRFLFFRVHRARDRVRVKRETKKTKKLFWTQKYNASETDPSTNDGFR